MVLWMIEKENESLLYPRTDSTYPGSSICLPGRCHSLFLDSHSTHFLSAKFFPLSFFLLLSSSFFSPPFFRSKSFASDASLLLSLFLLLLLLCMLINCAPFSQNDWLLTLPTSSPVYDHMTREGGCTWHAVLRQHFLLLMTQIAFLGVPAMLSTENRFVEFSWSIQCRQFTAWKVYFGLPPIWHKLKREGNEPWKE